MAGYSARRRDGTLPRFVKLILEPAEAPSLHYQQMDGSQRTLPELQLSGSLFHEHWWLAAVSSNNFGEITETYGGRLVGRLPFIVTRRKGFRVIEMPPFTRVLGPVVDA